MKISCDDYEHDSATAYDSAFASVFDCGAETDNDVPDFGDWNAGLVYTRIWGATLCLINSGEGKIKSRVLHIEFDRNAGMGFAVVDSNLYAFGGLPGYELQEFFVCDLNDSSPKFKRGGQLLTPKLAPIVIPYYGKKKKKKLFIIPCAPFGNRSIPKGISCEVVDLPCNGSDGNYDYRCLETPFDDAYHCSPPLCKGFYVSGKYAYINLSSELWHWEERLVCLDMDAEEFKFCDDPEVEEEHGQACRPVTTIESEHDKACRSTFVKAIYGLWERMSFICRDRLFLVRWRLNSWNVKIHVSSNLSSAIEKIELEEGDKLLRELVPLGFERMKELEEFVNKT